MKKPLIKMHMLSSFSSKVGEENARVYACPLRGGIYGYAHTSNALYFNEKYADLMKKPLLKMHMLSSFSSKVGEENARVYACPLRGGIYGYAHTSKALYFNENYADLMKKPLLKMHMLSSFSSKVG